MIAQQTGNAEAALSFVEEAIAQDPSVPHYHYGRGVILQWQERLEEALAAYDRAVCLEPDLIEAHVGRGAILLRQKRLEEAVEAYDRAVRSTPDRADLHLHRGVALHRQGRLEEALAACDRAVCLEPDYAEAHVGRGTVLLQQKRLEEALEAYDEAVRSNPDLAELHFYRGQALRGLERLSVALAAYEQALRIKPDYAEAHFARGILLQRQGRLDDAVAAYDQARRIKPNHAEAHLNCGVILQSQGRLEEALAAHEHAIRINPGLVEAHLNRGAVFDSLHRLKEALAAYDQALQLKPDLAQAHNNCGNVLTRQGRLTEALAAYERALRINPDYAEARSNYLFCLNFDPAQDDVALSTAHRELGERHGRGPRTFMRHPNAREPDRALRVGLVSADFGRHPVGYFLEPLLGAAEPARLQFVCYSGRWREDDLTERLRAGASAWRSTRGLSDSDLAEAICADGIDILIDLAGHTAGNRLGCFALRPAPIQVHWAGYCHSVATMDYSIWDPVQVPEGDERWFVEEVVRLPDIRWCYAPPEYAPEVAEPPALRRGAITFGSFNNLTKVNANVIALWARMLNEAVGARLLLSWPTLAESGERERLRAAFAADGIASERLELRRGAGSHAGVLGEYSEVDVALDPFPFTGCLTTCEALWMGLPVVTLPGTRPVSRQTEAFLTALGRTEWVATDADDYVRIATDLAASPHRLVTLRQNQRARMAASPICDGPRFAHHFEAALRGIWRSWCDRGRRPDVAVSKTR